MVDDDLEDTPDSAAQGGGLAEAQIAAIEAAFAEHDRMIARLRRDLASLQDRQSAEPAAPHSIEERLAALEARLEGHDQALRHMLQRLIEFFEGERPREP
jgi:uncharacterized coiled-coil protein SlyX